MSKVKIVPYGSWKSPITSDLIVSRSVRLGHIALDGPEVYWIESRPTEQGRSVIVRGGAGQAPADVTPAGFNVRTRVHEYGGGDFTVRNGVIYFINFDDQHLYRQMPGEAPRPLTPQADLRYADLIVDEKRERIICIREDHTDPHREPVNSIVSIDLTKGGEGQVLISGNDFYASPRLSPDGGHICWLAWNHPDMPWDSTQLWLSKIHADGSLGSPEHVAGGAQESIFQPEWSPDGLLYFVSDRTGWWNLYRQRDGQIEALHEMQAEFGLPQWVFGLSTYGFVSANRMICAYTSQGTWALASLNTVNGEWVPIETPYSEIRSLVANGTTVVLHAGSPTEPPSIVQVDPETAAVQILRRSNDLTVDPGYLSSPETIEFPTEGGSTAYALFYPPRNRDYTALFGELPPLLVVSHGGPTGAASSALNLTTQYWTSRGFAVLDVNYGGSTGYGRAYRERLNGQWGIVDVDDCVNAAQHLVRQDRVDGERLAIRGGSAGGYTTLAALT